MDAQLKALKVVDLKTILAAAKVTIPAKANKADLVARILASPDALHVFNSQNANPAPASVPQGAAVSSQSVPSDAQDVPDSPATSATLQSTPAADPVESKSVPAPQPVTVAPATTVDEDDELAKVKARAKRFGLEEPTALPKPLDKSPKKNAKSATPAAATATKNKRQPETVDPEEEERRRKRAARFGTGPAVDVEEEERRKQREARFTK
ncbi:hypothetical protein BXZ70DRAFT_958281 [Cristinia sonorae]|uniref:THO1-MOS11 C-terminal domain-containing protein n=1 Tax=Cristinia sonorae TaxID=1940300 RepID=A0A8K0XLA7_9AGAR|nr:hypothetical protein BXZ70DRAFT_958281 [Cristinia sonorae]